METNKELTRNNRINLCQFFFFFQDLPLLVFVFYGANSELEVEKQSHLLGKRSRILYLSSDQRELHALHERHFRDFLSLSLFIFVSFLVVACLVCLIVCLFVSLSRYLLFKFVVILSSLLYEKKIFKN